MSYTIDGYTIVNLVDNGSFEKETNGWGTYYPYNEGTYEYSTSTDFHVDGTYSLYIPTNGSVTGGFLDGAIGNLNSHIPIPNNHILYISAYVYHDNSFKMYVNLTVDVYNEALYGGFSGDPLFDVELSADKETTYKISTYGTINVPNDIVTNGNLVIGLYSRFGDSTYWDNVMVVDLTETFGAGNEPTKEWCDANIVYTTSIADDNAPMQCGELIFDRTAQDASYARQTQSSADVDLKGAYNASDLNRIECNCAYLADYLTKLGYACTIVTKTDWTMQDIPWLVEHINRIRYNVIKIVNCFIKQPNAPKIIVDGFMDYQKANNLEQCLQLTYDFIDAMLQETPRCDEYFCGEYY